VRRYFIITILRCSRFFSVAFASRHRRTTVSLGLT